MTTLAIFQNIGYQELLIVLVIGLLLFGRRLPEVGRSLGKSIVEFKKGLKGVEEDVEQSSSRPPARDELPNYRAPTSGGQDVRVSRSDPADASVSSGHGSAEATPRS